MAKNSGSGDPCLTLKSNLVSSMDFTSGVLKDLINAGIEPPPGTIDQLKQLMVSFIELEEEVNIFSSALKDIELQPDIDVELELSSNIAEIKKNQKKLQPHKHPGYLKLQKLIDVFENPVDFGATKTSEIDSELHMTEKTNEIDPITKQTMTDPVQNRHCGHHYERATILQHIRRCGRKSAKCPIIGCANKRPLTEEDLEDNQALKKYLKQKENENSDIP